MRRVRSPLPLLLALLLAGCDWDQFALLNSIPVHGDPAANPVVHVYLAVDGLSIDTVQEAAKRDPGVAAALAEGGGWSAAPLISMFPATSDASWGRILRTPREPGYEYQHYDPNDDDVKNAGTLGLATHALPELPGTPLAGPPYYRAFDAYADGYLSTLWSYRDSAAALAGSLDNLFFLLARRSEFAHAFTGYVLEVDALGHMQKREDVLQAFLQLWRRIERFKREHPERRYVFTLLSDHGMDFQPAHGKELLDFESMMPGLGLAPVKSMKEGRALGGDRAFAIPIIHTRVSYLALHTEPSRAQQVARLASGADEVDLALARASPRADLDPTGALQWYGLWRKGEALVTFGYDAAQDGYLLPADGRYEKLGLKLKVKDPAALHSDEALFALTRDSDYPDLFFRARTALASLSVEYPADVLLSFRRPYASAGFKLPGGANEIASAGFHGSMEARSSRGTLLTEEGPLPAAVRSDAVLELFPRLGEHVRARTGALVDADPGAGLDYAQVEAAALLAQGAD